MPEWNRRARLPFVVLFCIGLSCAVLLDFFDQFSWITLSFLILGTWLLSVWVPGEALIVCTICLVTVAGAGLAAEGVYRLAFLQPPEEFVQRFIADKKVERQAGVNRILGLSDSFGIAGGREHNYNYVLERLLSDAEQHFEMVNISLYSIDPPDQLALLQKLGSHYAPDIIVHGFFAGNDFYFPEQPIYFDNSGAALRDTAGWARWRPKNFLVRGWFLRWYATQEISQQKEGPKVTKDGYLLFPVDAFLSIEKGRLDYLRKVPSPQERFRKTLDTLDAIRSEAARLNAVYIMVIHPDQIQVEPRLFNDVIAKYDLNPVEYDLQLLQRVLLQYCENTQTLCLDLLPIFKEASAEKSLYMLRNTHYNPTGNRLAAQAIAQFLRDTGVVDASPISGRLPDAGLKPR